ncbi:response regulator transcription factor [Domibacillus enclensis]|uniref:DNA-binding response regulator n=1 Tax=Domibacillus enclensis TaxID=1017273 RepID=A0A1N6V998_9BACI|nr:response regulator [Domibacillus enclensis]OXS78729.1 DNA-binding response regulator [Domibacillus enclensis]SIQ74451.1 two-component system, response regulator YesN [Domibacillus enclensis]
MNILIVDDDRFVIAALKQKMDWPSLGIKEVYSASNIRQAQSIFQAKPIHLLISDIEMPQGSGLELLSWIRSEKYETQAIFLTNYADFNYAQKAIELQSFDYYLKPIEFDKLELIIKKAIKKVETSKIKEQSIGTGNYWQKNKEEHQQHFWEKHLKEDIRLTEEDLQKQLKIKQIDYSLGDSFVPLLIDCFPYKLVNYQTIHSVIEQESHFQLKLKTVITDAFRSHPIHLDSFLKLNQNTDDYLALFRLNDGADVLLDELVSSSNELIATAQEKLNCAIQCRLGPVRSLGNVKQTFKELHASKKESIDFRNNVFLFTHQDKEDKKYTEPNFQLLEHYLETENRLSFMNKCDQYLTSLANKKILSYSVLCSFRLDVTQIIYTHLKKKEILANKLFQGKTHDFLLEQSSRSIEDIMIYISYLVDVSLEYMAFTDSQKSVITTICDYIDQHYQENINRNSLAKVVYLSPDYIARFFKKEMGVSLVHYIIQKRVAVAKELLAHTDLPIHIISDKVGYGNYSYFTKIFKKETHYTPVDFRKNSIFKS